MICVQLTLSVKKMMYLRSVGKGNKGKAGRRKDNIYMYNKPYSLQWHALCILFIDRKV